MASSRRDCSRCAIAIRPYILLMAGSRGLRRIAFSTRGITSSIGPMCNLQSARKDIALNQLRLNAMTASNSRMASLRRSCARRTWPLARCANGLRREAAKACPASCSARLISAARELVIPSIARQASKEALGLDRAGVEHQRPLEMADCLGVVVRCQRLQGGSASPQYEIQRVWMLDPPCGLRGDQLEVQRDCQPSRDRILQREEIARIAIEPLGPQMRVAFGIDELGVDADLVAQATDAPFQQITDPQLTANLLGIDRLVPISERRVVGDHEHARKPRQILSDPVREILLLPVVAEVGKGQ